MGASVRRERHTQTWLPHLLHRNGRREEEHGLVVDDGSVDLHISGVRRACAQVFRRICEGVCGLTCRRGEYHLSSACLLVPSPVLTGERYWLREVGEEDWARVGYVGTRDGLGVLRAHVLFVRDDGDDRGCAPPLLALADQLLEAWGGCHRLVVPAMPDGGR